MTMRASSEHLFGVTRRRPTKAQERILDHIAREEGAHGFTWIIEPGTRTPKGWFSGPNRGFPFGRDMAKRVLDRVAADERVSDLFEGP